MAIWRGSLGGNMFSEFQVFHKFLKHNLQKERKNEDIVMFLGQNLTIKDIAIDDITGKSYKFLINNSFVFH